MSNHYQDKSKASELSPLSWFILHTPPILSLCGRRWETMVCREPTTQHFHLKFFCKSYYLCFKNKCHSSSHFVLYLPQFFLTLGLLHYSCETLAILRELPLGMSFQSIFHLPERLIFLRELFETMHPISTLNGCHSLQYYTWLSYQGVLTKYLERSYDLFL